MSSGTQSKKGVRLELNFSPNAYAQLLELKDQTNSATPAEVIGKALALYRCSLNGIPAKVAPHWRAQARVHARHT